MRKGTYFIARPRARTNPSDKNTEFVEVSGSVLANKPYFFGINSGTDKESQKRIWIVTDLSTGISLGEFPTKAAAIEDATSQEIVEIRDKYVQSEAIVNMAKMAQEAYVDRVDYIFKQAYPYSLGYHADPPSELLKTYRYIESVWDYLKERAGETWL